MIEKVIDVGGKQVTFRSSATVPRLYRIKFKRDIFKDLAKLEKAYSKKTGKDEDMQIDDLEIFENVAYIMAFHADPTIPKRSTSGWISLRCLVSTRCSRKFSSSGARTC